MPAFMLKSLRNKKIQKRIYLVLAAAIIPPFLFWGVSLTQKESDSPSSLGIIGRQTITVQNYLAGYKAVQHQISLMFGENAQRVQGLLNVKGQTWDRLLLLYYAKKERLRASDDEVVEWLTRQPVFSHQGRFNDNFYKVFVTNFLKTNPRAFEEEIRGTLTIGKIRDRMESKIQLDDGKLKKLYSKKNKGADEKKWTIDKAGFKEQILNKKTGAQMRALLESLRSQLKLNLETMKDLFPEEAKT